MKYRGIFEYEYPTEHKPPVSIDVHLHGDCVKGKIIEWEYRPLEQEPSGDNVVSRDVVKEQMIMYGFHAPDMTVTEFVEDLPPVNSKEPTTQERQAESDKFDAAFQDGYNCGYAQARFDYEQEPTTKNNLGVDVPDNNVGNIDCISRSDAIHAVSEKQKYIDTFNAIDLLHTQQYIDDSKCSEIEHNLLYTIVGRFALELTHEGEPDNE